MAGAYLEITMKIGKEHREAAAAVYHLFKEPFLKKIAGAVSKELLVRDEDVQVLHGFVTPEQAKDYLHSDLFRNEVFPALKPRLAGEPEIRIYNCI